jgi:hypothetical protein
MMTKLFGIAVTLTAFTVAGNAQTVRFNAIGSSALFLQAGLAASTPIASHGVGATCVWSQKSGLANSLQATDPTVTTSVLTETGNAWVAWTPGSTGTCAAPAGTGIDIYAYLQTDSVIGNRCYANGCTVGVVTGGNPVGSTPSNLISSSEITVPQAIWTALNNHVVTAAGTDIRPEDAVFATNRGLTACGQPVSGSSYLGLGYASAGIPIHSFYSTSTFHVVSFTLPSSYAVLPVGAVPIVVGVNPSGSGFGSGVSNIDHTTLARFLDGTLGLTGDLTGSASNLPATVLIREPLSGTYNTMEFSIPNTTTNSAGSGFNLQTSQDVGTTQPSGELNCDGSNPIQYPAGSGNYTMHIASADSVGGVPGYRNRAIGTGQEVSELLALPDSLGYAFWSTANFAAATSTNVKYLTVDGADPLYDPSGSSYSTIKGQVPTATNGYLTNVTFTNLQDGTYPIWSLLRLVTSASGLNNIYATKVATAAQYFISATSRPDFVPFLNTTTTTGLAPLAVAHSHFAPPGYTGSVSNGTGAFKNTSGGSLAPNCSSTEAGGDVGGVILGVGAALPSGTTLLSDNAYCAATSTAGQTGLRK